MGEIWSACYFENHFMLKNKTTNIWMNNFEIHFISIYNWIVQSIVRQYNIDLNIKEYLEIEENNEST